MDRKRRVEQNKQFEDRNKIFFSWKRFADFDENLDDRWNVSSVWSSKSSGENWFSLGRIGICLDLSKSHRVKRSREIDRRRRRRTSSHSSDASRVDRKPSIFFARRSNREFQWFFQDSQVGKRVFLRRILLERRIPERIVFKDETFARRFVSTRKSSFDHRDKLLHEIFASARVLSTILRCVEFRLDRTFVEFTFLLVDRVESELSTDCLRCHFFRLDRSAEIDFRFSRMRSAQRRTVEVNFRRRKTWAKTFFFCSRSVFDVTSSDVVFRATSLTFDPSLIEILICLNVGASICAFSSEIRRNSTFESLIFNESQPTILQVFSTNEKRFSLLSTFAVDSIFSRRPVSFDKSRRCANSIEWKHWFLAVRTFRVLRRTKSLKSWFSMENALLTYTA